VYSQEERVTKTQARRQLGPDDAGVPLTDEEYEAADYAPGYRYELVTGRLYVSPAPNQPHCYLQDQLFLFLGEYARRRRDVLKRVTAHARVMTRALGATTDVQPDLCAYRDFPADALHAHWRDTAPLLVVEVVSASDPGKDLVRNRGIYWAVPSILEYWIVDPRDDVAQPTLLALVRGPEGWLERPVPAGGVYRTDLLPGLEIDLAALLRT
jgi:Uma2 family endonuclease